MGLPWVDAKVESLASHDNPYYTPIPSRGAPISRVHPGHPLDRVRLSLASRLVHSSQQCLCGIEFREPLDQFSHTLLVSRPSHLCLHLAGQQRSDNLHVNIRPLYPPWCVSDTRDINFSS